MPSVRLSSGARVSASFVLAIGLAVVAVPACSSSDEAQPVEDAAADAAPDIPEFEAPVLDGDDPMGRVLVLPIYYPDPKRCYSLPTEIGHFDEGEDGKIAPCAPVEVCYVRTDGVLAYHTEDCVHGTNFRANWERQVYSDLGPCEPLKHLDRDTIIKDCPNVSCVYARDVVVDTAKGCATAITSKGCRDTFGKPTSCFCDGTGNVYVAADPKSPKPPTGFTACDATDPACKKALDVVDTVAGCATTSTSDAGTSDAADAPVEGG